jgi:hypothetical protein
MTQYIALYDDPRSRANDFQFSLQDFGITDGHGDNVENLHFFPTLVFALLVSP